MKLIQMLALGAAFAGCALDDVGSEDTEAVAKAPPSPPLPTTKTTKFTAGPLDANDPFAKSLGTNGRACVHCHTPYEGWSMTPALLAQRFDASDGTDPVFRPGDGAVSPVADVSTVAARRTAYAMLLSKGVIRVGIGIPANAEFDLVAVDDPYHYASAGELSLFRRPLPSTNLKFLSAVMWDGREASLGSQAIDATMGHAQATGVVQADMDQIVGFETSIYTSQIEGDAIKDIQKDTNAGPDKLSKTQFFIGINDPLGMNPTGAQFNPRAMTLFDGYRTEHGNKPDQLEKAAIYRGQELFNTKAIEITGVRGLNDRPGLETVNGTCSTCHDTPNVGNHSVAMALDVGVSDASVRTPDMPLYTLRNKSTGETVQTTDPGRALITGKWADLNKFKGPVLRGVGLRPPYFHNGSAATLEDAVDFYDGRFGIGFTAQEKSDLVAFLKVM